jgi:hypothetical protein
MNLDATQWNSLTFAGCRKLRQLAGLSVDAAEVVEASARRREPSTREAMSPAVTIAP